MLERQPPTTFSRLRSSWPARIGAVIVLAMGLVAAWPQLVARYDPDFSSGTSIEPPSWRHWLGTDRLGKDVYSRACYGARLSLLCGVFSVGLAVLLGVPAGAFSGYFAGLTDALIMRSID